MLHYADLKENRVIFNDEMACQWSLPDGEPAPDLDEPGRFISIPPQSSRDGYDRMELFAEIYVHEPDVRELLMAALKSPKPFRSFKDALAAHPKLEARWYKTQDDYVKERLMNWLEENGLELEDRSFLPQIRLLELDATAISKLPDEIRDFGPKACLKCHNRTGLKARYVSVNVAPTNAFLERLVREELKKLTGLGHFGVYGDGKNHYLTVCRCPKCTGEEIFWDF